MAAKIYALLVGINDYAPEVGRLAGCLNDVDHFKDFLTGTFDKARLAIEVLKDSDATRGNLIKQFRSHLGKAREGDVAVLQYCGHGARWKSAAAFKEFFSVGKDEGLVCYDSRRPGGFDLADKELAVLLAELAKNNPHVAVILDCCHSGSGTRTVDAFRGLKPRVTHEVSAERPLDSYVEGYYARLQQKKQPLSIPASRHILLAACERTQQAQETPDCSGVFTDTLLEVLSKCGGDITYADLFVRCRAAVRTRADNQNPQFEAYENFNAWSGFLGRAASQAARRYSVYCEGNSWKIDAGALHGLPTEPEKSVALALYREDEPSRVAGSAATVMVGPQKSELRLGFAGDPAARYQAEITTLPVPPLPIYCAQDEKHRELLQNALAQDGSVNATLTEIAEGTQYALAVENGKLVLRQREMDLLIQGVELNPQRPEESLRTMLAILKHVVRWERSWALQNHGTKMDTALVDFVFSEKLPEGEHDYPAGEITLDYVKSGGEWQKIPGKFKVRNRTQQTLHMVFAHFSNAYGIQVFSNEPVPPGEEYTTLQVGGDPAVEFWVEEPANHASENFKLIVSTEKVDDFLLTQEALELGKVLSATRGFSPAKTVKKYENDWFTKSLRIKIVRQQDQIGSRAAQLASGQVVVKAHASFKANLSLNAVRTATRGVGEVVDFYKAFERQGMAMLNFAGTRGDNESVLELTDIQNAEALRENPLEVELHVPLQENEGILPLVFDGQHVLLGGDPVKDEQGNTHISIDHIPEVPDNRRSVGKALKLYFFKTYLKQNVNQLCWVEYKADGTIARHKSMLAEKVNAARNLVVLIHGIIGDTENLATGLHLAGLDQQFDLVLTFDYENLNTPIAETALDLKKRLEAAGLGAHDDKKLTLVAHSMGGLVSRWFIEREGGNTMVDHLVMCGTPNQGSPFGKIDTARKLLNVLTGVAMNYVPALIPFNGAILFALNRSKKITPTLEQMHPASEFITTLNSSGDPGVRYTILAGDIATYQEPSDQFFAKMLAKAGKGLVMDALFGNSAHDIAVGVESILGIDGGRNPMPKRVNVACHHLNYFISAAGQQALQAVAW